MTTIRSHVIALTATALVAALFFMSLPTQAATRVQTMSTSCSTIQKTLVKNGAALLRYPSARNPNLTLYDRYVADSRFCASHEIGKWASVPAKDTAVCRVIACERFDPKDVFPFKRHPKAHFRISISH